MDAGEEMLLLEENTPSPDERSGSPMLPDTLISSDDDLMGDDVPVISQQKEKELDAQRAEMETPPLVENPQISEKKIEKEAGLMMPPPQGSFVFSKNWLSAAKLKARSEASRQKLKFEIFLTRSFTSRH